MPELKCRTVRLWLQAPDELSPLDARYLERHLSGCTRCAAYRRQQVALDRQIRQSLDTAVGTVSVRELVRERLRTAPPRRRRTIRLPVLRLRRLVPALALAPISAVAVAIALFLLPTLTHRGVTPTSAGFHAVRPSIGFPLTVDPAHPNHLLAGAWGQVYQSWDAGQSWSPLGALPPLVVRDVAIDPTDSNRYLVASLHSVYVSDDAGKHWQATVTGLQGAFNVFIAANPNAPGTFYVGPSILWKSTNHGASWTPAGPGHIFAPSGIQSLTFAPHGELITGIWGGGVAISRDGGLSWQRRARGLAPHVLDVATGANQRLWAATNRGAYRSTNGGLSWKRRSPAGHLFTTSVLDGGAYVLVGGDGGVFRSTDGGRHWRIATDGLPLAAYVFGFIADPHHPQRVYASLDSDGIFRSDDGGLHWQAMNNGLPIAGNDSAPKPVLFRRDGMLWSTPVSGIDPGNLTVDTEVRLAAISPDGASVAYVTGSSGNWAAKVLASGGSSALTLVTSAGPLPHRVLWSPSSSLIALVGHGTVVSADLRSRQWSWSIPAGEHVLGWTSDGRSLLLWQQQSGRVILRSYQAGVLVGERPGVFPEAPLIAPDGRRLATLLSATGLARPHGAHSRNRLFTGTWLGSAQPVAHAVTGCELRAWSDDSTRLLLTCAHGVQVRDAAGRLIARAALPANAFWVPGSNASLLFFQRGSLWRWSGSGKIQRLVRKASTVYPSGIEQ